MKVVVPFATKAPMLQAVRIALVQDGWEPEFLHCTKDTSYYELISGLWKAREDFCLVEHDIVIFPGALTEMEQCTELWCTRPYYCSAGWIEDGLGCTRFSRALMEQYPDALDEPFPQCCKHDKRYCGLDRLITHKLRSLGLKPHVHMPGVSNLNERWT